LSFFLFKTKNKNTKKAKKQKKQKNYFFFIFLKIFNQEQRKTLSSCLVWTPEAFFCAVYCVDRDSTVFLRWKYSFTKQNSKFVMMLVPFIVQKIGT
jgi:hypothetical protein